MTAANIFVGQERAHAALDLGVRNPSSEFNIFVSGLTGAEKLEAVRGWIVQHAAQAPTPCDGVYVHNFAHPDAPQAIALTAGRGTHFQRLMQGMVKTLRKNSPKLFARRPSTRRRANSKRNIPPKRMS